MRSDKLTRINMKFGTRFQKYFSLDVHVMDTPPANTGLQSTKLACDLELCSLPADAGGCKLKDLHVVDDAVFE